MYILLCGWGSSVNVISHLNFHFCQFYPVPNIVANKRILPTHSKIRLAILLTYVGTHCHYVPQRWEVCLVEWTLTDEVFHLGKMRGKFRPILAIIYIRI